MKNASSFDRSAGRVNDVSVLAGLGTTVGASVLGVAAAPAVLAGVAVAFTAGKIGHILNLGFGRAAPEKDRGVTASDALAGFVACMTSVLLGATSPFAWGVAGGVTSYAVRQARTLDQ